MKVKQEIVIKHMSRVMRKRTFCICENKDADQLRGNREADRRPCFRYMDSAIPLLSKSEISSLKPSSVVVQPGLCWTRPETRMLVFSLRGSNHAVLSYMSLKCNIQVWTYRLVYVLSTCKFHLWLLYTEPQNILIVESNNMYISSFSKHFC